MLTTCGLSILTNGFISLPNATSYEKLYNYQNSNKSHPDNMF